MLVGKNGTQRSMEHNNQNKWHNQNKNRSKQTETVLYPLNPQVSLVQQLVCIDLEVSMLRGRTGIVIPWSNFKHTHLNENVEATASTHFSLEKQTGVLLLLHQML